MVLTLDQALERAAADSAGGLRLLDARENERWLPWSEVRRRAAAAAGGLAALGLARGDRVALVYPTCAEFFDAFFGTLLAGGVPVPLYPPVRLGRLDEYHLRTARMLRACGARLVLADPRVRRILGESVEPVRPALGCRVLGELPEGSGAPPAARPEAGDLALIQFSSGTTVDAKPVALTHRAVMAQVAALNQFWPDSAELRHTGVSWLPLYHDMGLIGCVFPAVERGTDLTLIPPEAFVAGPALWLRAISRFRASVSPAPNFAYGLCVEKIRDEELEGVDLSPWLVALNGAEPVAPSVLRAFNDRFRRWGLRPEALTPVYGLSEAALAVTFSDPYKPFVTRRFSRRRLGPGEEVAPEPDGVELVSVGRPIPGFELSLRDETDRELPERRVGRIWTRGPSLMRGYLGQPEKTARVLRDGWLDTGDLGFLYAGELYLTGRAKDVIIVRGRNYPPDEIEQTVNEIAGVRKGCAAAVSHLPEGSEREELVLFVERARPGASDPERLVDDCRRRVLAVTGLALDRVLALEPGTLPRTSSGKIRRQEALRRHLAGELEPPDRVTPLRLARAMLRSRRALGRSQRGS